MSCPAKKAAIAVFDSGLGGLTVVKAIRQALPDEKIIYYGDTARVPYGNKSAERIRGYAREISDFLLTQDIKLLVIACNTASAWALDDLEARLPIPVLGVIQPGVETALATSCNQHIAILGTRGTISSGRYQESFKRNCPGVKILGIPCPLFVPLVEEQWLNHPITDQVIQEYLVDIHKEDVDTVLLACTHYPLLMPAIQRTLGPDVRLVDSASACATQLKQLLKERGIENLSGENSPLQAFVSDDPERFASLATQFLGEKLEVLIPSVHAAP